LHEQGVFRARFTVSAQDLAAPAVELFFGKIEGDGKVFVNGQQIGSGGDPARGVELRCQSVPAYRGEYDRRDRPPTTEQPRV